MSDDDDDELPVEQAPWARATIRAGRITLNPWVAPLVRRGGPMSMLLDRLDGVALADLFSEGEPEDEELVVRFVTPSPQPPGTVEALLDWAATTGYRRVWLPDRVVDIEPPAEALGVAEVDCPTCGLLWRDDTPEFWRHVHYAGAFPASCLGCGGSLPEWTVVRSSDEAEPVDARDRATVA